MDQPPKPPPLSVPVKKKYTFKPKVQPRPPPPIHNKHNEVDAGETPEKLLKTFKQKNLGRDVPKVEKKCEGDVPIEEDITEGGRGSSNPPKLRREEAEVQVAFGHGAPTSTSLRKYGNPNKAKVGSSDGCSTMEEYSDANDGTLELLSTSSMKQDEACPSNLIPASPSETEEYEEPYDYENTNYLSVLPLRKPYSGDPAILDQIEFGDPEEGLPMDEETINTASQLGLLEVSDDKKMFLLQLPPLPKISASDKGKGKAESSTPSESNRRGPGRCTNFEDLPEGWIGKMLVYKSGKVKLKVNDVLFDVEPGTVHTFAEDIVAVDTKAQRFCNIGELAGNAVVIPDVNSLVDSRVGLNKSQPK